MIYTRRIVFYFLLNSVPELDQVQFAYGIVKTAARSGGHPRADLRQRLAPQKEVLLIEIFTENSTSAYRSTSDISLKVAVAIIGNGTSNYWYK